MSPRSRSDGERMSLVAYRKKRIFSVTPEPTGEKKPKREKQLRYCVQKHLASHLHYDIRLEYDGVLLSWAVPKGPSLNPIDKRLAIQVEDHPIDYGSFEGVIPSGYGAGIVLLWDTGFWVPHENIAEGLKKGALSFDILGEKLHGSFALTRLRSDGPKPQWLLLKKKDAHASIEVITTAKPRSVKSKLDFDGILRRRFPKAWLETPPAKGGEAGSLFAILIARTKNRKGGAD